MSLLVALGVFVSLRLCVKEMGNLEGRSGRPGPELMLAPVFSKSCWKSPAQKL
jgi:hypothetical protein